MSPERGAHIQSIPEETVGLSEGERHDAAASLYLATAFGEYNLLVGVPEAAQTRVDELLAWQDRSTHPKLGNHGRRVGTYAGALVRDGDGRFASPYYEGRARVMGALHDIGKTTIDRATVMRSLVIPGWGVFDRERDMPAMAEHSERGFEIVDGDPFLPLETKYVIGCHHGIAVNGDQPYGIPFDKIDEAFDDPGVREWVRYVTRCVTAADKYDSAMTRDDGYLPDRAALERAGAQLAEILPDNWQTALGVLETTRGIQARALQASAVVTAGIVDKS